MSESTLPSDQENVAILKDLREENELLLLQLHQVQEELEEYYLRNLELEKGQGRVPPSVSPHAAAQLPVVWVDDELPALKAENIRLQALADAREKIQAIEQRHSLNARLGTLLVRTADEPGTVWKAPTRLLAFWRQESRNTPTAALGGKDFSQVKAAHAQGGLDAVRQLLDQQAVSAVLKGNAYTALARTLMHHDRAETAQTAWLAYGADPKPFRLKWLAFRLHEAGTVLEAEALLDMLPEDINFSDSEANQVHQLRYEAKRERELKAQQDTRYAERRHAAEATEKSLRQTIMRLEAENAQLQSANEDLNSRIADEKAKGDQLVEDYQRHEAEQIAALDAIQRNLKQLETEKAACASELQIVRQSVTRLEAENAQLQSANRDLSSRIVDEKAKGDQLVEDCQRREAEQIAALDAIQRNLKQLETEKAACTSELQTVRQSVTRLEAENAQLQSAKENLNSRFNDLRTREKEREARQQLMNEELVRAETQINLIKDLILREGIL